MTAFHTEIRNSEDG